MADGLMRCRMYGSWDAFRRGWKRIYAEAARRYPVQIRKHARRVRIVGAVLPMLALVAVLAGAFSSEMNPGLARATWVGGAAALLLFLCAIGLVYRAQRMALPWVLLYPIGAWRVGGIMHEAARDLERDTPTTWAGRSYQRARAPKGEGAS